jgi:hypothetical protein
VRPCHYKKQDYRAVAGKTQIHNSAELREVVLKLLLEETVGQVTEIDDGAGRDNGGRCPLAGGRGVVDLERRHVCVFYGILVIRLGQLQGHAVVVSSNGFWTTERRSSLLCLKGCRGGLLLALLALAVAACEAWAAASGHGLDMVRKYCRETKKSPVS